MNDEFKLLYNIVIIFNALITEIMSTTPLEIQNYVIEL